MKNWLQMLRHTMNYHCGHLASTIGSLQCSVIKTNSLRLGMHNERSAGSLLGVVLYLLSIHPPTLDLLQRTQTQHVYLLSTPPLSSEQPSCISVHHLHCSNTLHAPTAPPLDPHYLHHNLFRSFCTRLVWMRSSILSLWTLSSRQEHSDLANNLFYTTSLLPLTSACSLCCGTLLRARNTCKISHCLFDD